MKIEMNSTWCGLEGRNDDTTLNFRDLDGNVVSIDIDMNQCKTLLEQLYMWAVVKHNDTNFYRKHAEMVIKDFSQYL